MPHDSNGKLVQAGDLVSVRCEVVSVHQSEDYCNVSLKTVLFMPPYTEGTSLTLNTKQVEVTDSVIPPSDSHSGPNA